MKPGNSQPSENDLPDMSNMSRDEVVELAKNRNDFVVDLDNLKPQKHKWVDRGLVVSCEGGDHPPHRSFKRR